MGFVKKKLLSKVGCHGNFLILNWFFKCIYQWKANELSYLLIKNKLCVGYEGCKSSAMELN